MSLELSQQSVGKLVSERPSRSSAFERWGIDYCCGGKKSLADACAEKELDLAAVLRDLEQEALDWQEARQSNGAPGDWMRARLSELTAHIVTTHHGYLREALPRLGLLTVKVRDAHAARHPELRHLARVFASFRADMEAHTQKEERVLFPYIEQLERAEALPRFHCGSVQNPIQVMEREHEAAGEALATMRRLTNDFRVPAGACATYRAMLDALAQLEVDTHRHVHKENSILFPRAQAREAELAALPGSLENKP